ncbi:sugar ABC transporter substrate-binding protein [Isosphaeraceae bacterium EP7]
MSRADRRVCRGLAFLSLLTWGLSGCDPAPPPDSPETAGAPAVARRPARQVALVLPGPRRLSTQLTEQFMRQETGKRGLLFRSFQPEPEAPPSAQAASIRQAMEGRPSVLMVIPERAPEVAEALEEARLKKVPVLLLDVPLGAELPYPIVRNSDYTGDARKLLAAAMEDAQTQGFPAQGPAVIVRSADDLDRASERAEALRLAAQGAGLTLLDDVRYVPSAGSQAKILEALAAHPEIALVLVEDDLGLEGGANARLALKPAGKFIIAGFAVQALITSMVKENEFAATVDRNLMGLVRQALAVADTLAAGGAEPSAPVAIPLVFKRGYSDRSERVPPQLPPRGRPATDAAPPG